MKTITLKLSSDDPKVWDAITTNFEVCRSQHTLPKLIWERYAGTHGQVVAVFPDWIPIENLSSFRYSWTRPLEAGRYEHGLSPKKSLAIFIDDYLRITSGSLVVFENLIADKNTYVDWKWGPPPPVSIYDNSEIYHVIKASGRSLKQIEDVIRKSFFQWGTAVCSIDSYMQDDNICTLPFLSDVSENANHIIIPAFDDDGFLIWSPLVGLGKTAHRMD
jgi:hypothetical protein